MNKVLRRSIGCLAFIALLWGLFVLVFMIILPYQSLMESEHLAKAGNAVSQERLGRYYQGDTNDIVLLGHPFAGDYKEKAVYWFEAAAKGGDIAAIYELPRAFEKDFPGTRNDDVVKWYKEAARRGFPQAASRLSEIFANGELGQPCDPKQAAYWRALSARE